MSAFNGQKRPLRKPRTTLDDSCTCMQVGVAANSYFSTDSKCTDLCAAICEMWGVTRPTARKWLKIAEHYHVVRRGGNSTTNWQLDNNWRERATLRARAPYMTRTSTCTGDAKAMAEWLYQRGIANYIRNGNRLPVITRKNNPQAWHEWLCFRMRYSLPMDVMMKRAETGYTVTDEFPPVW